MKYKRKLEEERKRLLGELEVGSKPEDFGSDTDHFDEEADEAEELANKLAAHQALKDRVSEIDAALGKIADGKYGVCEKCGGEMSEELLDIAPESHLCTHCKRAG